MENGDRCIRFNVCIEVSFFRENSISRSFFNSSRFLEERHHIHNYKEINVLELSRYYFFGMKTLLSTGLPKVRGILQNSCVVTSSDQTHSQDGRLGPFVFTKIILEKTRTPTRIFLLNISVTNYVGSRRYYSMTNVIRAIVYTLRNDLEKYFPYKSRCSLIIVTRPV